jgi:hypothetical protein
VIPASISLLLPPPTPVPPPTRWPEYRASLPIWEKFVDKERLLTALHTSARLLLASDGGAADLKGPFGALLAEDEKIILECGGRAYGADPPSFRVEGYGMLAILRLVFHVAYFYCTRNRQLRYTLYCDSDLKPPVPCPVRLQDGTCSPKRTSNSKYCRLYKRSGIQIVIDDYTVCFTLTTYYSIDIAIE